jgi:hypothetical protein
MCAFFLTEFIDWDSFCGIVFGHAMTPGGSLANVIQDWLRPVDGGGQGRMNTTNESVGRALR